MPDISTRCLRRHKRRISGSEAAIVNTARLINKGRIELVGTEIRIAKQSAFGADRLRVVGSSHKSCTSWSFSEGLVELMQIPFVNSLKSYRPWLIPTQRRSRVS